MAYRRGVYSQVTVNPFLAPTFIYQCRLGSAMSELPGPETAEREIPERPFLYGKREKYRRVWVDETGRTWPTIAAYLQAGGACGYTTAGGYYSTRYAYARAHRRGRWEAKP